MLVLDRDAWLPLSASLWRAGVQLGAVRRIQFAQRDARADCCALFFHVLICPFVCHLFVCSSVSCPALTPSISLYWDVVCVIEHGKQIHICLTPSDLSRGGASQGTLWDGAGVKRDAERFFSETEEAVQGVSGRLSSRLLLRLQMSAQLARWPLARDLFVW